MIVPRDYGAKGDGVTDDTAALVAARNAAVAAKEWLDGEGLTYAVTGQFDLVSDSWFRDLTFRQLAPGVSASVVTLSANGLNNVRLIRVAVDRNGDGTNGGHATGANGCLDSAVGTQINNCTNSHFEDLEVYGADTGTGIRFQNLGKSNTIIRPWAHNMTGINPVATDENIQGIHLSLCTGVTVIDPKSHDHLVTYNNGTTTDRQWTRGIAYSGCHNITVLGPQVDQVGEGNDVSGDAGNQDIAIIGGSTSNCWNWGVKTANLVKRIRVIGHTAIACDGAGFVDSSSFDTQQTIDDANIYESCTAVDCGDPARFSGASGFCGLAGTHAYTNGVKFRNCVSIDTRSPAKTKYGYYNEKVAKSYCLVSFEESQSINHTVAPFSGEHEDRCHVALNSTSQSIPNSTWTEIVYDTEVADTAAMHDPSNSPGRIFMRKNGVYLVIGSVLWTGNGTGHRTIQLTLNGGNIAGARSDIAGEASANHTQSVSFVTARLKPGDTIGMNVLQTSGGALTAIANSDETGLIVQRVG